MSNQLTRVRSRKAASLKVGEHVRCIHHCGDDCVVTMVHWDEQMQCYFYGIDGERADQEGHGHHRTELRKVRSRA